MPYAQCSRRYPYAFKWPRPLCHFRLPSFQYPSVRTNFAMPIYSDGRIWSTLQQVQQVFVSFQTIVWSTVTSAAMLSPFSVPKTGTTPDLNLPRPSEQRAEEPRQPTARFVAGGRKPDLFREAQILAEALILVKLSHLIFSGTDPFSNRNGLLCPDVWQHLGNKNCGVAS